MKRPLGPGGIFWAVYPGERGGGKRRPMIIASRRADIINTGKVLAVVCSTTFSEPLTPHEVYLPSIKEGGTLTKLPDPTVAVCDWTTEFPALEIEVTGCVSMQLLREICQKANLSFPSGR